LFSLIIPPPPCSPLFPYTTLFRSRYALISGDVLTRRDIARLRAIAPSVICVNVYGATESPQIAVYYVVPTPADSAADGLQKEGRSEEHTSELQSRFDLVCRLLLEK